MLKIPGKLRGLVLTIVSRVNVSARRMFNIQNIYERNGCVSTFYITIFDLAPTFFVCNLFLYNKVPTDWIFVE